MMWEIVGGTVAVLTLFIRFYYYGHGLRVRSLHVVITGGSSGIGKSLAAKCLQDGAKVTIMARTESKLKEAKQDLLQFAEKSSNISYQVCNVTDYEDVKKAMLQAVLVHGPPNMLIMSAGSSQPGYFLDMEPEVFQKTMTLNYMGCVNCAKVMVPMLIKNGGGNMIFIASAAATVSFLGYSSYSPSKFAVRGLADALRNELTGMNIRVQIAYPPDTDTPGYENENKTKPRETSQISPPDLYTPDQVADSIYDSILRNEYHLASPDAVQNLLITSMTGITPRGRWFIIEVLLQPVVALVEVLFGIWADRCARPYGKRVLQEQD